MCVCVEGGGRFIDENLGMKLSGFHPEEYIIYDKRHLSVWKMALLKEFYYVERVRVGLKVSVNQITKELLRWQLVSVFKRHRLI